MNIKSHIIGLAEKYNNEIYFNEDPIIFPKHFRNEFLKGRSSIQDIEIAAIISAHLAWGKRKLIVRDCTRAMDEMNWKPYEYIMRGKYKCEDISLHRTIKWSDFSSICGNLKKYYLHNNSLETLSIDKMRINIYGQKPCTNCANKKINMLRRWLVRDDGKVDLGIWKNSNPRDLLIPLDVHVYNSSLSLGITDRRSINNKTVIEITEFLKTIFPDDPTLGDFALFAHGLYK